MCSGPIGHLVSPDLPHHGTGQQYWNTRHSHSYDRRLRATLRLYVPGFIAAWDAFLLAGMASLCGCCLPPTYKRAVPQRDGPCSTWLLR